MTISAAMVKELRTRTGAGMMECKNALMETEGDMDAAAQLLRTKGAAKADKKSARVAAEGAVVGKTDELGRTVVLVEVNSETDFVAKDANFIEFANHVAETIITQRPGSPDDLQHCLIAGDKRSVEEARVDLINKIGENIGVRRFILQDASTDSSTISTYFHGNRIGVYVELSGGREDLGKDLAMHVAASRPVCVSEDDVPEELIAKEKEVYTAQARETGKPEEIMEKMIQGRLKKYLNEITLLGQAFVKDPDKTVQQLLASENAKVIGFRRFEVGEGIEKREDDFVAEVMAQANKDNEESDS